MVVFNARIYSLDADDKVFQAMAIRDGRIVELGADRQILNKYKHKTSLDAGLKTIIPGFVELGSTDSTLFTASSEHCSKVLRQLLDEYWSEGITTAVIYCNNLEERQCLAQFSSTEVAMTLLPRMKWSAQNLVTHSKDTLNAFQANSSALMFSEIENLIGEPEVLMDNRIQLSVFPKSEASLAEAILSDEQILKGVNDARWLMGAAEKLDSSQCVELRDIAVIPLFAAAEDSMCFRAVGNMAHLLGANHWFVCASKGNQIKEAPLMQYMHHLGCRGPEADAVSVYKQVSSDALLRSCTIWAAMALFEEDRVGSLEKGKQADFLLLDRDLFSIKDPSQHAPRILKTYVAGEMVFQRP